MNKSLSFNSIYSSNYNDVLNYISMKIKNTSIAEELCNDAFLRVNNHLDRYDSTKASVKTWLYTIVNNLIIDYYRASKKESLKQSIDNNLTGYINIVSNERSAIDKLNDNDVSNKIRQSINNLSTLQRKIANLYFIQNKHYNEIAEILGISLDNVKVLIHRVRKELQVSLQKKGMYI